MKGNGDGVYRFRSANLCVRPLGTSTLSLDQLIVVIAYTNSGTPFYWKTPNNVATVGEGVLYVVTLWCHAENLVANYRSLFEKVMSLEFVVFHVPQPLQLDFGVEITM